MFFNLDEEEMKIILEELKSIDVTIEEVVEASDWVDYTHYINNEGLTYEKAHSHYLFILVLLLFLGFFWSWFFFIAYIHFWTRYATLYNDIDTLHGQGELLTAQYKVFESNGLEKILEPVEFLFFNMYGKIIKHPGNQINLYIDDLLEYNSFIYIYFPEITMNIQELYPEDYIYEYSNLDLKKNEIKKLINDYDSDYYFFDEEDSNNFYKLFFFSYYLNNYLNNKKKNYLNVDYLLFKNNLHLNNSLADVVDYKKKYYKL